LEESVHKIEALLMQLVGSGQTAENVLGEDDVAPGE